MSKAFKPQTALFLIHPQNLKSWFLENMSFPKKKERKSMLHAKLETKTFLWMHDGLDL